MVVLPLPPIPHIPIMRTSDDLLHKSVLSRSMREPIPTRPLESPIPTTYHWLCIYDAYLLSRVPRTNIKLSYYYID